MNTNMRKLIYIVDDEENIRELIKSSLEDDGHEVEAFENGEDLLEKFEVRKPNLVILDIMMPKKDGLSTCDRIRKESDIPIILLTARDSDADFITGFTLGCDDYFTKPFSPVKLMMRVRAIFNRVTNYDHSTNESKSGIVFGDLSIDENKREVKVGEDVINYENLYIISIYIEISTFYNL